jgi:hypothetical protein
VGDEEVGELELALEIAEEIEDLDLDRDIEGRFGNWRLWGSTDLRHWFNLDRRRPRKHVGLVLDLGERTKPVITPDDPQRVIAVLRAHGVSVTAR